MADEILKIIRLTFQKVGVLVLSKGCVFNWYPLQPPRYEIIWDVAQITQYLETLEDNKFSVHAGADMEASNASLPNYRPSRSSDL